MMAAYNAVNGTPAHVHPMLREIVMKEWGLDGIICTDGGGLRLLVSDHKAFPDLPTAAAACIKAGINHFLDRHKEAVTEALKRGLLTEADIDQALRGLFRVSIRLGLLDPPERVPYAGIGAAGDPEPWAQPETRALVREVTRKSIVLLKNSANLLPLDRAKVRSVAVVGPLANQVLLDWYSGTPPYAVTPREGIERVANPGPPAPGAAGIGVNWVGDMGDGAPSIWRARATSRSSASGTTPRATRAGRSCPRPARARRRSTARRSRCRRARRTSCAASTRPTRSTVVVLVASFPIALPWAAENATTILHVTHASQELGNALADVLFGDADPGGRLVQTWPQVPRPAAADDGLRHPPRPHLHVLPRRAAVPLRLRPELHELRLREPARRASTSCARGGAVDVSVDLTNTGRRRGDEVVQLYVRYPASKVERPAKQLRGFRRVSLEPGETRTVRLPLAAADLAYWDSGRHAFVVEPGPVELLVGRSSADSDLTLRRTIVVAP